MSPCPASVAGALATVHYLGASPIPQDCADHHPPATKDHRATRTVIPDQRPQDPPTKEQERHPHHAFHDRVDPVRYQLPNGQRRRPENYYRHRMPRGVHQGQADGAPRHASRFRCDAGFARSEPPGIVGDGAGDVRYRRDVIPVNPVADPEGKRRTKQARTAPGKHKRITGHPAPTLSRHAQPALPRDQEWPTLGQNDGSCPDPPASVTQAPCKTESMRGHDAAITRIHAQLRSGMGVSRATGQNGRPREPHPCVIGYAGTPDDRLHLPIPSHRHRE